jgi:DNA processing protein
MAERALVIAEQPPGSEPLARNFPYRNRIIAGMAIGTLVVEAAPRSGSLITARLASEMGREVMAIPGAPFDSRARGCNELIRNGGGFGAKCGRYYRIAEPDGDADAALAATRRPVLSARISEPQGPLLYITK